MNEKPSFVFFGTPHFAALALDELYEAGLVPELIVTAPDKPAGRGLEPYEPAVKKWAVLHGVPFIQPESLKTIPPELTQKSYDVFVVAAYGKILRPTILSLPAHGCLNLHPSLLPRFRGASPIESQILANEQPVGVSIILLDEEMDHGPIIAQREVLIPGWPIGKIALTELLAKESGKLAAETIAPYVFGLCKPKPQDETRATYTKKIEKSEGLLDLSGSAHLNYLKYLAYEGWPGTFFFIQKGGKNQRVKITKASYSDDTFTVERIIIEGKSEQDFKI